MAPTDTSEKGLESLIVEALTRNAGEVAPGGQVAGEGHFGYPWAGWVLGDAKDYDRASALDLVKLFAFLRATQPKTIEQLGIGADGPKRLKFLARLQGEITKRGVVDVLRQGMSDGPAKVELFYGSPSPNNPKAIQQYEANLFSVTRQLRYSQDDKALALDLALFINGLPIATFELKNRLTKQGVLDAIRQYENDRDPQELLFQFGRCLAHFAVDDQEVRFCTQLRGKGSVFLPFNKGWNDGAGNPPNPKGLKTDYLWRETLERDRLTEILESYAQLVKDKGGKKRRQIFPRYHQLDVVRKLLADAKTHGAGRRYLIQHSAGSGKSNSIAWLAYQLVGLERGGKEAFDSVIVVTDRRVLDKQLRDTILGFKQVSSIIGAVTEGSSQLREFIEGGKKIIITTVQKFPFVLAEIGDAHRGRSFAIIIDEAHSSQGGRASAMMNVALAEGGGEAEEETTEDAINRVMESRKMLPNASYFAFTATPKNKTLEIFGVPYPEGEVTKHRPFHVYTMKQAIEERFILDVLENYTPVDSYYRLAKTIADDPEYDVKKAQKKLRKYVESNEHAIREKAEIMVDHFHDSVLARNKIHGRARAMVVTGGVARAIEYFHAFDAYLKERKSPYRAIVAFSGEHDYGGTPVTESSLNGFPSSKIEETFQEDSYRFLICADKFQTGYDEPLLHTMYVDKALSDIKAVQTLSRLNRACPGKHDTFVLDFQNDAETIQAAFAKYYKTAILAAETDPNKLHDLQSELDAFHVYDAATVDQFVERFLAGADRPLLDPILDACAATYVQELDEEGQVGFKGRAKAFVRTYGFLASILPFSNASWEKLSTFLHFLVPKLPAPKEEDLAQGIQGAIDMDSYRVEVRAAMTIALADENAEIAPVPTSGGGRKPEPELDRLSHILQSFNDLFGNIPWKDKDRIGKVIAEEIPVKVAADKAYQNAMKRGDKQNARIEHDSVLEKVIADLMSDHIELFAKFSDDPQFKSWLKDKMFAATYTPPAE